MGHGSADPVGYNLPVSGFRDGLASRKITAGAGINPVLLSPELQAAKLPISSA